MQRRKKNMGVKVKQTSLSPWRVWVIWWVEEGQKQRTEDTHARGGERTNMVLWKRLKKINHPFWSHLWRTYNCVRAKIQTHAPPPYTQSSCHYSGSEQWIKELMMHPCEGTSNFYCPGDEGWKEWMWRAKERQKRQTRRRGELTASSTTRVPAVSPPPAEPALIDLLTRPQISWMAENTSNKNKCWMRAPYIIHTPTGCVLVTLCLWGWKGSETKDKLSLSSACHRVLSSSLCSKRNENSAQLESLNPLINSNQYSPISHKQECCARMHACTKLLK